MSFLSYLLEAVNDTICMTFNRDHMSTKMNQI